MSGHAESGDTREDGITAVVIDRQPEPNWRCCNTEPVALSATRAAALPFSRLTPLVDTSAALPLRALTLGSVQRMRGVGHRG